MAIAFYPWVIATKSERNDPVKMNHERIHIAQQKELWVVAFYILYLGYSLGMFFRWFSLGRMYTLNMFEVEAFGHEIEQEYICRRKKFASFMWSAVQKAYVLSIIAKPISVMERICSCMVIGCILVLIGSVIYSLITR
jgi:hypothetical protein